MPFTHIYVDTSKQHGQLLRGMLAQLEAGRNALVQIVDCMATMIDGDSGDAANYGEVATRFGFASNAAAKAAFDELNSVKGKLTTDSDVTFVQAALNQVFSKFR